jgi:hypothetical protein
MKINVPNAIFIIMEKDGFVIPALSSTTNINRLFQRLRRLNETINNPFFLPHRRNRYMGDVGYL